MQRFFTTGAAFALVLALLGASAQAATISNRSDTWAWITVYSGARSGIISAFCLAPGHSTELTHGRIVPVPGPGGSMIPMKEKPYEVRAEVTKTNCAHPVMLDATLGYDGTTPYYVHGSGGKYAFRHTP